MEDLLVNLIVGLISCTVLGFIGVFLRKLIV